MDESGLNPDSCECAFKRIPKDGAKWILGCSSKTYNEAVRGDMGLDTSHATRKQANVQCNVICDMYVQLPV